MKAGAQSISGLGESLGIMRRVIGALLMREILLRWGRHNIGFLWMFGEPMLFTIMVTILWTVAGLEKNSDLPIVAFALTGYSAVLLWRNMPSRLVRAVEGNHTLMHHRNIKMIDVYFARLLLEGAGATISFTVLALVFSSLGWMSLPVDPLEVVFGWLMMTWFGCSLAITVGSLSERSEIVHTLWHPAAYILFPLSGTAFMVNALPEKFQHAVLLLPMVHGVEIIREGFFGNSFKAHYSVSYMAACCLVLTIIGISQMRVVSRRITV